MLAPSGATQHISARNISHVSARFVGLLVLHGAAPLGLTTEQNQLSWVSRTWTRLGYAASSIKMLAPGSGWRTRCQCRPRCVQAPRLATSDAPLQTAASFGTYMNGGQQAAAWCRGTPRRSARSWAAARCCGWVTRRCRRPQASLQRMQGGALAAAAGKCTGPDRTR